MHIGRRSDGSIILLRHNQEPFTKEMANLTVISPTNLAKSYIKRVQADYDFDPEMLLTLDEHLDRQLRKEESRLR